MPGKRFEKSIKKKDTYEKLREKGVSKSSAAAISNKQAQKGGAKEMGKKAAETAKGNRKPTKPAAKKK